jgi:hypothetical protein
MNLEKFIVNFEKLGFIPIEKLKAVNEPEKFGRYSLFGAVDYAVQPLFGGTLFVDEAHEIAKTRLLGIAKKVNVGEAMHRLYRYYHELSGKIQAPTPETPVVLKEVQQFFSLMHHLVDPTTDKFNTHAAIEAFFKALNIELLTAKNALKILPQRLHVPLNERAVNAKRS